VQLVPREVAHSAFTPAARREARVAAQRCEPSAKGMIGNSKSKSNEWNKQK